MRSDQLSPLPVCLQPNDDESGLGYAMRAFRANGLSLDKVREWLQIRSWTSLTRQQTALASWYLGISPDWLRWRLIVEKSSGAHTSYSLLGCKFVATSLRPTSIAALCPDCVRIKGFSRVSWLLKCVVICSEHRTPISEVCGKCGQSISWNRPSVDVCDCGRYFLNAIDGTVPDEQLLCWVRWIEWRLGMYCGPEGARFAKFIPNALNEMSLDGAMRLVVAFGILDQPTQAVGVSTWRRLNNREVADVIKRGLSRLLLSNDSLESLSEVGSLVHLPILERMRSDGVETTDLMNASQLVTALKKTPYGTWDRRVKLTNGQRSLFW